MAFKPTEQQDEIVTGSLSGQDMVVQAGAGTGKTSTLKLISGAMPKKKLLFVAYNKAIQVDAAKSFPSNATCKTSHALAYAAVGIRYKHRLNGPRQTSRDVTRILFINEPARIKDGLAPLAPQQLARITMETVKRFCYSGDDQVTKWHVPRQNLLEDKADHDVLAQVIVPLAERAWKDIQDSNGRLRFDHDYYLKLWALSRPQIGADIVLLDEAQDSNKAVAGVVMGQHNAQVIMVGDSAQSIYGWRGATDAMATFHGTQYLLSQSFRFGPAVAAEANKWLDIIEAPLRLTGFDKVPSVLAPLDRPDAVLCRTNAGAVEQVMQAYDAGRRPALVGGGKAIAMLAAAALDLKAGRPTSHPELYPFPTWAMVQDYAENDSSGSDLKSFVKLIDKYGADVILDIMNRLTDEDADRRFGKGFAPDLIVSTAHKSKGLEWNKVRVADDFREPVGTEKDAEPKVTREDAMLAYVTVTRAQTVLDRGGLSWVDNFGPGGTLKAGVVPQTRLEKELEQRERETITLAAVPDIAELDGQVVQEFADAVIKKEEWLYVENDSSGSDLKSFVKLIDKYGADVIAEAEVAPAPTVKSRTRKPSDTRHLLKVVPPVAEPAPKSTCTCDPAAAARTRDLTGMECGPDVPHCLRCGGGWKGVAID